MNVAESERTELASLLNEVGPDEPTLCEGWTTRDLAAHLVVRQNRVDAQAGLVIRPLAGWMERVRRDAAKGDFAELIDQIRSGPPWWSLQRVGALDEATNALEYLVHHEDVRRAKPGWKPRPLPDEVEDEIWLRTVRVARLAFRRARLGIALARPDGEPQTVKSGEPVVVVRGEPVELALWAYGRTSVADVVFEGDPAGIERVKSYRNRV